MERGGFRHAAHIISRAARLDDPTFEHAHRQLATEPEPLFLILGTRDAHDLPHAGVGDRPIDECLLDARQHSERASHAQPLACLAYPHCEQGAGGVIDVAETARDAALAGVDGIREVGQVAANQPLGAALVVKQRAKGRDEVGHREIAAVGVARRFERVTVLPREVVGQHVAF